MADGDPDENGDGDGADEAEILSALGLGIDGTALRRRNPSLDDQLLITDEEYASGRGYRYAREKNQGSQIDSRITDRDVETESKNGARQYIPLETYQFSEEKVDVLIEPIAGFPTLGIRKIVEKTIEKFAWLKRTVLIPGKKGTMEIPTEPEISSGSKNERVIKSVLKKILEPLEKELLESKRVKDPKAILEPEDLLEIRSRPEVVAELKRRLPEALRKERRWGLTPMSLAALPIAPLKPFFMIPNWLLDEKEAEEEQRKQDFPDELVRYQYCGCDNDEELISFIRTDPVGPDDNSVPPPLPMVKEDGQYKISRRFEDLRGISLRVHNNCAKLTESAAEVYELELETKERTGYYEGLEIFSELPEGTEKSDEAAFAYIAVVVKQRLDALPADAKHAQIREVKKWGKDQAYKLRKYYKNWLEKSYDRWLPSEAYDFREEFLNRLAFYGDDWQSKADRLWDVMQLQLHVIKEPTVTGIGADTKVDWSTLKLYIAPIECRRYVVFLFDHWKYSKAFYNTRAAFDADDKAPSNMRQRNWGFAGTPRLAKYVWRWNLFYNRSIGDPDLCLRLMGPAWVDKQPWQEMNHDGSLIQRFGAKAVAWVGSMGTIKTFSSKAGTFSFPLRKPGKGFLDDILADFRDYDNEYKLLLYDEYFAHDPVDVIENQKAVVIFSILDDVNARLKGRFARYPGLRLTYKNCCQGARFVEKMWKCLPAAPIVKAIEGTMRSWKRKNVPHFRVEIDKMLDGVYINRELRPYVEKWYRDSDERVWDNVYYQSEMMSTLTEPGSAYGFEISAAMKLNNEGFGTGYGPIEMWQHRQEVLAEVGLDTGYFSVIKGVLEWWSVRVTATKLVDEKSWPDVNDLKSEVSSLLKSRKLIYVVAEQLLWPKLHVMKLLPTSEPFPIRIPDVDFLDKSFIYEVLNTKAGTDYVPTYEEADSNPISRRVRDEILNKNQDRYNRIATGRYFEINK